MDKKLIATDFDGTLNINGSVSDYDREAIDKWRESGRYFGVVTGRGEKFYDVCEKINLPYDYLILYNGALAVDKNKNVIFQSYIPDRLFREIDAVFAQYDDNECDMRYDGTAVMQFYATFPSTKRALEVADEISKKFSGRLNAFVNGVHVNVCNAGISKASGIDKVLEHFSLPADSAAAVGDDYNDLDMIIRHNGWAVESGKPDVISASPHTCKSVGDLIHGLLNEI